MRLRRLDLTRFGRFTDRTLDFGEAREGRADLHIVYGPNEAGKSTASTAILDLLFGIASQSRYNFLHPYPTMRIGAALEIGGDLHEVVRIKRPQNSLIDGAGQPLAEHAIAGALGGIDRAGYQSMFSLDDLTLEAGGESILASKGDLGQLLFSASAGLADLSRSLVGLKAEADGFYRFKARSGELIEMKARLAALKAERERIDTLASHFVQLIELRDRAFQHYEEAIGARGRILARAETIQRLLNALPRLAALREIRGKLIPLAALPAAPRSWAAELPALQTTEVELATRMQGLSDEIAQASSELDAIVVDEIAADLAGPVERLATGRYVTAVEDLPDRRLKLREAELVLFGILDRLERPAEPAPARLVLGSSVVGALRDLIERRSGVEAALASADDEVSKARRRLDEATARLRDPGDGFPVGSDRLGAMAALGSTLAALRGDDHAARRRLALRASTEAAEVLAQRLAALRPWIGEVQQLVDMEVPEATAIARRTASLGEAERRIDRYADDIERLTGEVLRQNAAIEAIDAIAGVLGDAEAVRLRAARDAAWNAHRGVLDAQSAQAFEAALHRDDAVTQARASHSADLAALRQATEALAVAEAGLAHARSLHRSAVAVRQGVRDAIADMLRAMSPVFPDDMLLPQLEVWIDRRARALEAHAVLLAADRDRREAESDAAAARHRLTTALNALGIEHEVDASLDGLVVAAETVIARDAAMNALRDAAEDRRRDLSGREDDSDRAVAAERSWAQAWASACAACWIGEGGTVPSVGTVREVVAAIAELGPALERRAGLADRIGKMERDQATFVAEAEALAERLGLSASSAAILDVAEAVRSRVQTAQAARTDRALRSGKLDVLRERQRTLAGEQAVHARRKAEMTSVFGVATLTEVADQLREIERRAELDEQADALTREVLDGLGVASMAEAEASLDAADRVALAADLAAEKARFADLDQRSRDLFADHGKAADGVEAVGGDDAVARLEEKRRTILLDIEERALRYLRLRVGAAAAEQALRAYRDQHRSSMMARASDAFRIISRGAYSGLATQPDRDSEVLIAVGADGRSREAGELSKGTRFQLYLALRVAGYHEFARSRPAVPFIADDIMETFDDVRAEQAFRLLAGMAQVGQVIYFTHHQHLCEIVRHVEPGVTVHTLATPAMADT